ncbi:Alpha-tubulin N-acetyltransferase [Aphelenchoides bicaudatus]|nr:Alpha-tubulin N-acetyltransferase [Aphelenchoides bicaudatus]
MEAPPSLLLTLKNEPIQLFDKTMLKWIQPRANPGFEEFVNKIASDSAKARGLPRPLTTFLKLVEGDDEQKLYILWQKESTDTVKGPVVYGYAKTTQKQLYLRSERNELYIQTPLCIMDFYIVEAAQKHEHGLQLFNYILENEKISAAECAFDNPTTSFLSFLEKHYGLTQPIWQSTRFVVFRSFFDSLEPQAEGANFSSALNSRASSRRSSFGKSPPATSNRNGVYNDKISEIIHPSGQKEKEAKVMSADTAQGRKYHRDFTHQNIW